MALQDTRINLLVPIVGGKNNLDSRWIQCNISLVTLMSKTARHIWNYSETHSRTKEYCIPTTAGDIRQYLSVARVEFAEAADPAMPFLTQLLQSSNWNTAIGRRKSREPIGTGLERFSLVF